ncbi:unnamed protein product [Soboliphyme baturini]|uniref:RING-type E3 ubiquitin transferase n=1 Tax=Soboliphyme baturini TaxID=241478 RepID=A0A183IT85_9BILA|nr:unnamed protein product [Soboliphyme baturini]
MGAFLGRQRQSPDEDIESPVFCYKYPPKTGSYFGTHFMLGDERFETMQPESFLFGENCDLNFLGSKPVQFPYLPRVVARPLNCLIAIRRDSLKFVRVSSEGDSQDESSDFSCQYNIEFVFDCDVPCTITIYYFATEIITSKGLSYVSAHPDMTSSPYRYDVGCNQLFCHPEHFFNPPDYKPEEMNYDPNLEIIPVVIHCVEETENHSAPQSHSTFATIERSTEEHSLILKPLKQKLFIDNVCYLLQEVYGVENKSQTGSMDVATTSNDFDESGVECVVCMSEWRDTLILPCRHLCLCNICAETLRYKASNCPICRSPFRALLQIKSVRKLRPSSAPMLSLSENAEKVYDANILAFSTHKSRI